MLAKALEKFEKEPPPSIPVNISGRIVVDLLKSNASNAEAIRVFDEAIQKNPQAIATLGHFGGRFLEISGDESQAISYYEKSARSGESPFEGYAILFSKMRLRELRH